MASDSTESHLAQLSHGTSHFPVRNKTRQHVIKDTITVLKITDYYRRPIYSFIGYCLLSQNVHDFTKKEPEKNNIAIQFSTSLRALPCRQKNCAHIKWLKSSRRHTKKAQIPIPTQLQPRTDAEPQGNSACYNSATTRRGAARRNVFSWWMGNAMPITGIVHTNGMKWRTNHNCSPTTPRTVESWDQST